MRDRKMRKGITIAFLGIDGTGKSTHSKNIGSWLQENELKCVIIPFHKWMFAGFLKKKFGYYVDMGRDNKSLNPYMPKKNSMAAVIKPLVAFIDNLLMFYLSKWKYRRYDILIFDRFICATLIKFKALNYNVEWFRPLWQNIRTDIGIVLDTPMQKSIGAIQERGNHILYTAEQLLGEREENLEIARKNSYPVFDTSGPPEIVNEEIKNYLKKNPLLHLKEE